MFQYNNHQFGWTKEDPTRYKIPTNYEPYSLIFITAKVFQHKFWLKVRDLKPYSHSGGVGVGLLFHLLV